MKIILLGKQKNLQQNNKMEGFKPTIIGIGVYVVSMSQINEALQALLIIATLVYTVIKTIQLLDKYDKK